MFLLFCIKVKSQTSFAWDTYSQGSLNYSKLAGGITMSSTISAGGTTTWTHTPSTNTLTAPKYINQTGHMLGLLLSTDWTDKTSVITQTIDFSTALCGTVSFNIFDVNTHSPSALTASQVFKDSLIISGKDGSNNNITPTITSLGTCTASIVSNRVGGALSCGSQTISVNFGTNSVKQIIIQYLSGRSLTWNNGSGTSPSSSAFNPRQQHIIISSIDGNIPPTITTQPANTSTCSTGSATLSITAPAGPYQWQYFNGSTWNNVVDGTPSGFTYANATTNNLTIITSGATTGTYPYRCVVGSGCSLNSSTANLTINGPATTGMATGDWVWTGAQSIVYELAGNWLSWNGTVLSVPANPPTTTNNVRIKPTTGCVLRQPTVTNSITVADATGSANCRDIVIESGATLTFTNTTLPNNAHFHITGNYNNQGTVVPGTGRIKFVRNSGSQSITDASGTATFYEMNVAYTSTVILNNNVTVTNAIRLSGVISTGTNRVYLNTTSIDDGSTTGFVTYTGHVFGNLRRRVVTNTNSYYFPVGVSNVLNTGRRLLEWMNNNTIGITDLDCSVSNTLKGTGNNIDAQLDVANKAKSFAQVMDFVRPEAEWTLTPNTAITGGNYGLRLYLQNFAAIPDNKFTIMKRPDASTTFFDFNTFYLTTTIPPVNNAGRIYNSGNGYAEKTGFTAFSKFVVATSADILPIELKNYNIECAKNKAVLSWQTASETNNHYFTIWRSDDGVNYDSLAFLYGAGNSSQTNSYTWTDNFQNDVNSNSYYYYKISQTDFSGEKKYFPAKFFDKSCGLGVFPNPIFDRGTLVFYLNGTSKVSATLYNALGQLVRDYFIDQSFENGSHLSELNMDGISSGIYYLNVNINNDINTLKISIQKE